VDECSACQGGFSCEKGKDAPEICPAGSYCPPGSEEPTPCPSGRYNPKTGKAHRDDCKPCKAGYYCRDPGLGNLLLTKDKYKCKPGHFCHVGTKKPEACRAGTYADPRIISPGLLTECPACPEHFHCPHATGQPVPCARTPGTYCPVGRGYPRLCPPGKYCRSTSVDGPISIRDCPKDRYCPLGTSSPLRCKAGEVCPKGSVTPRTTGLTAASCKAGTYFGFGVCNPCEAGFLCKGKTTERFPLFLRSEKGEECPAGHYCPASSSEATACPVGTHRLTKKGASVEDCSPCPKGSFNSREGQQSCSVCGRGAQSAPDFQSCTCVGRFRTWRESTRSCTC
jgi:hypothetical protein